MRIKDLVWVRFSEGDYIAVANPLGTYALTDESPLLRVRLKLNGVVLSRHKTLQEAKKAAQDHFKEEIFSALEVDNGGGRIVPTHGSAP